MIQNYSLWFVHILIFLWILAINIAKKILISIARSTESLDGRLLADENLLEEDAEML